ncbi:MAG: trypsin-like peptidase domain-containing protein [Acidobacteria bacterium]|jgi:serine protease Do|nr:trypsin-like peptidase domain-containing protein [Acidobacteriota bacterium]
MTRAASVLTVALVGFLAGTLGYLAGGGFRLAAPVAPPGFAGTPPSFAAVVARVNPAVVHVDVIEDGRSGTALGGPGLGLPRRGEGSGFIVDPDGYILTNHHLVPGPARVRVRLTDRRELAARRVGSDPSTDLALLKVEARGLPAVTLGDSERLRVGDWVCAIGNPLEFDNTVTVGVVSSKGRKIFNQSFDSYIQTDAAINPGSSGGPLVNLRGEAIGISAAVSSEAQGIGFAIPSNVARSVLVQLREEGRVRRGYLGVELHELDPDLAAMMGLREARGALVVDVSPNGAAARAGLRRWDVITAVDGAPIDDGDDLVRTISALRPGTSVRLSLLRDGRTVSVSADLAERTVDSGSEPERVRPTAAPADGGDALGLVVGNLGAQSRAALAVPHDEVGVVIRSILGADPGTDVLEEGDLIVEVNRQSTRDVRAYSQVLGSLPAGGSAWLYVYRPDPPGSFLTRVQVEGRR